MEFPYKTAVTHQVIDNNDGTYTLKQKCSIPDAKALQVHLYLANTAEQIDFLRKALSSYKPACTYFKVVSGDKTYECSPLPYREGFINYSKGNSLLYCDFPSDFDRNSAIINSARACRFKTNVDIDESKPLSEWTDDEMWTKHSYILQAPSWICENGTSSNELCLFAKVENDISLEPCGEADGYNERGITPESDLKKYQDYEKILPYLENQNIVFIGGDSVSRQILMELWKLYRGKCHPNKDTRKLIKDLIPDAEVFKGTLQEPVEAWTTPAYCVVEEINMRFFFVPHGSPMLRNFNSGIGKSTADKLKAMKTIMKGDGRDFHFLIGPGYHFSTGNPAILIKEYLDINNEAKNIIADFPKANFYYKELHWLKLDKDNGLHMYFFGTWNSYRHNLS